MTDPIAPTPTARPGRLVSIRAAPASAIACGAAVVIFLGISSIGGDPTWEQVRPWGYLPAEEIWDRNAWGGLAILALATSAFVHFELWHLAFNVYWLWTLGRRVESWTGPFGWLLFAFTAAVVGSAAQLLASTDTGVGASGIVYALVGLLWHGRTLPEFAGALPPKTMQLFLVWLLGCFVATFLGWADVANAAHIAGFLFGVLVAEWRIRRAHPRLAAACALGFALMVVPGTFFIPWSPRWCDHVGQWFYQRGLYRSTASAYELGLLVGVDSARALFYLSVAYDERNDITRSREALAALRKLNPADADTLDAYFAAKAGSDSANAR